MKLFFNKQLQLLLVLVLTVISIKALREPDSFWQLATGNWILNHFQIPTHDIFSYTFAGNNWVNIKWGYEVLASLWVSIFGLALLPLLQLPFLVLLCYWLIKLCQLKLNDIQFEFKKEIIYLSVLFVVINSLFRFTGRPEIISHTLFIGYIYLLTQPNKKWWWALPVLQIIWTNMHEAFGLGLVVMGIFVFTAWVNTLKSKSIKPTQLTLIALVTVVSIGINPYGVVMYVKPFEIFGQLSANKFTSELVNYTQPDFWQPQVYIAIGAIVLVIGAMLWFLFNKKTRHLVKQQINLMQLSHVLLFCAVVVLAQSALRNLIFLNLLLAPWLALSLTLLFSELIANKKILKTLKWAVVLIFLLSYVGVVSNAMYKFYRLSDRYGLMVSGINNPIGAAQFLANNGLDKQVLYTDYLASSYLLYALPESYKSFIDLRDLDVFADTFFYKNAEIYTYYDEFLKADSTYKFKGAVVLNAQFPKLLQGLYADTNYTLAYLDPLISIYTKKELKFDAVVGVLPAQMLSGNILTNAINYGFNPFYTVETENLLSNMYYAKYLADVGDYKMAYQIIAKHQLHLANQPVVQSVLGRYYYQLAMADTAQYLNYIDTAQGYFMQAIKAESTQQDGNFYMGLIRFNEGYYEQAAQFFKLAWLTEKRFMQAQLYEAECYKLLVEQGNAKKYLQPLIQTLKQANAVSPDNPDVIWNLGMAYFKNKQFGKAKNWLEQSLQYTDYLPQEDVELAQQAIAVCNRN